MKPKSKLRAFLLGCSSLLATFAASSAFADNASWTGGAGTALWSDPNNWGGPPAAVPGTGNTATFNAAAGAGGTVIDLGGGGVTVNTINFTGAACDAYTIGSGGANAQSLTLNASGDGGIGLPAGAINFPQTITVDAAITVNNTQQWYPQAGNNPYVINGNVTPSGPAASTRQVKTNGRNFTFNGLLADQVGGAKLQIAGANATTATLTNPNNTFTGGLAFENGIVSVNSIGLIGNPSAAGSGGILQFGSGFGGGTFVFTGAGTFTTDRVIDLGFGFNGGTVTQSGASGLLKFTAATTATSVGSPTLVLQGNGVGGGEIAGSILDNGTIGTTLVKTGGNNVSTLQLFSVDGIVVGASVSAASGIAPGTTVTAINTGTKTITLSANTTANVAQNSTVTVDGVVNITHVTKNNTGTWTLSGASTHSGLTKVSGGTLFLTNPLALQNSRLDTAASVTGSTTRGLKTDQTTLTLGGLSGDKNLASVFKTIAGGYSGVTALTLNPGTAITPSYSAVIADGASGMTLTKTGAGTQILSGTQAYTGGTTVSAGTLGLGTSGSIASSPSVAIAAGATLDTSGQASYVTPVSQSIDFGVDATGAGSAGKITADGIDVSNAAVTYNITGTPDDAAYVLATYTTGQLVGTFSSVPTPPSGYTLEYTYEGNKIALVQTGGNAYDTWAGTFGGLSDPTPSLDFDNGGLDTGIEWVVGGDPTDGSDDAGNAPTSDNTDPDFLIFTYNRSDAANLDANTTIKVEYGNNLTGWTEAVDDATNVFITETPGSPADVVEVKLRRSALGSPLFARLNVLVVP